MNSRERLMAALTGAPMDRPGVNFYEIGGFKVDPASPDAFNIYNSPDWQPILRLAEEETDLIRLRGPLIRPNPNNPYHEFYSAELFGENNSRFVRTTLRVAGRTMTSVSRRDAGIDTVWTVEPLLKDVDDLRAYLQLPDEVYLPGDPVVSHLIEEDGQLGDRGLIMLDAADPICRAAGLFSMETYTFLAYTEQALFHRLLERISGSVHSTTEAAARQFPGQLWRIFGAEYATEPYLPTKLFEEYVVRYTKPMLDAVHKHGGLVRIHCHGRIRNVLPHIVDMGADAIDPIEPPPLGDVSLRFVREHYGKHLTLFGNIEARDIEFLRPKEFEKIVAQSLREGTTGEGRGFVLTPSAAPYGRDIPPHVLTNYRTMTRLTREFHF